MKILNARKILFTAAILLFLNFLPVKADNPSVLSVLGPSAINSGQLASLTWTISGGGHALFIPCLSGVKFKNNGADFPCNTRKSVSALASDGIDLLVFNVSGGERLVTVKIIPKDASGSDYDYGSRDLNFIVNSEKQPISSFTAGATTTTAGSPLTLSWQGANIDGVNLKFDCREGIRATSPSYSGGILPCGGQTIFPTDLPGTGSLQIQFTNDTSETVILSMTLLPAMSPGIYNGAGAATVTVGIASNINQPVSVLYFNSSSSTVYSGDPVSFYWNTANAVGANLKISCNQFLSFAAATPSASTSPIDCDRYISDSGLPTSGTTTITFFNNAQNQQTARVSLIPQRKDLSYDGVRSSAIDITVRLKNQEIKSNRTAVASTSSMTAANASFQNASQTAAENPESNTSPFSHLNVSSASNKTKQSITLGLGIGSRNKEVKLLQEFLKNDQSLYPEGAVTGYFGRATERAVGRFQIKYKLLRSFGDSGYGFVGPKTRALLNSLF